MTKEEAVELYDSMEPVLHIGETIYLVRLMDPDIDSAVVVNDMRIFGLKDDSRQVHSSFEVISEESGWMRQVHDEGEGYQWFRTFDDAKQYLITKLKATIAKSKRLKYPNRQYKDREAVKWAMILKEYGIEFIKEDWRKNENI